MGPGVSLVLLPPDLESPRRGLSRSGFRPEASGHSFRDICLSKELRKAKRPSAAPGTPVGDSALRNAMGDSLRCPDRLPESLHCPWDLGLLRELSHVCFANMLSPDCCALCEAFAALLRKAPAFTVPDQAYRRIRTGQLNALLRLHLQPIDVVVYHGPQGDLVSRGASRLDAFSGYPVRT